MSTNPTEIFLKLFRIYVYYFFLSLFLIYVIPFALSFIFIVFYVGRYLFGEIGTARICLRTCIEIVLFVNGFEDSGVHKV